jgi:hypothetical protein
MSLPEQGAKVATSVVDAMKSQPLMLAVIVLNVVIIGLVYLAITANRQQQHIIMEKLVEQNSKAQELLARCVVPGHTERENDDVPLPPPDPRRADAKLPI